MNYEKFDKTEIEAIAEEFKAGKIPANIKTWYEYRDALQRDINDAKRFLKMHSDIDDKVTARVKEDLEALNVEMNWVKSIKTFDLYKACEYLTLWLDDTDAHNELNLIPLMARKVLDGECADEQFVRDLLEESNYRDNVHTVRKLTRPVAERRWGKNYNRPTEYYPQNDRPVDATQLYDHREHYVYIHSTNVATWGESYWISVDCANSLDSLPVIKAFKEFDFEVGKFYKIQCVDEIQWGNGKRKYIMEIEESNEEEFLEKGFIKYATRSRY